ncbi:MAG: quinoprotein glucose dehydrogenase, partial [Planctomycetota bacterium]
HKDKRVRLEAQYLLAEVGVECLDDLHGVANDSAAGIARLHAIWGCAQIARLRGDADLALGPLCGLEGDADPEVRAQLCKALGEADLGPDARELAYGSLVAALKDEVQRVRVFAAQGLGKLGDARAAGPLFDMIRENADVDPWLRHAGVSALAWIEADSAIAARAGDPSVAVRRAALLVMRRSASTSLEGFLGDEDPELVAESARAIYDLPIESSYPALANIIESERALSETTWRRIVNACRHVGGERNAIRLASFSSRADLPIGVRVEALEILGEWGTPYPLDRITGEWHPVAERSSDFIGSLALGLSSSVVSERNGRFAEAWAELARTALDQSSQETRAGLAAASSRVLGDSDFGSKARRAALRLQAEGLPLWRMSLKRSLQDGDEGVRAEAFGLLDRLEDGEAIALLKVALTTSSERVVQGAVGALARIKNPEVDDLLAGALNGLAGQESPRAHTLELIEAVESRGGATLETALANYRSARPSGPESAKASSEALDAWARFAPSLRGGDVEAGRKVFFEKSETSCVRCHRVAGSDKQSTATGGEAGPELVTVGSRLTHSQILESILYPNASIAEGFENWILAIEDEGAVAGRIVEESDEVVVLETKDDGQHEYHPNDIEGRKRDLSGMPGDVSTHLSRREMRDLVAFLAAQKAP